MCDSTLCNWMIMMAKKQVRGCIDVLTRSCCFA